jgi:hypothetical protein
MHSTGFIPKTSYNVFNNINGASSNDYNMVKEVDKKDFKIKNEQLVVALVRSMLGTTTSPL